MILNAINFFAVVIFDLMNVQQMKKKKHTILYHALEKHGDIPTI